jgi:hypothetical protein
MVKLLELAQIKYPILKGDCRLTRRQKEHQQTLYIERIKREYGVEDEITEELFNKLK